MMTLPLNADVRGGIRKWDWLGNGPYGDCMVAAFEHDRMVKGVSSASTWDKLRWRLGFRPPHAAYTVEIYTEFLATQQERPGPNMGVDPNAFFPWAQEHNLIMGWGTVNVDTSYVDSNGLTARDRLHLAMIQYGGVLMTIQLTKNALDNYILPTPWHIGPDANDQPSTDPGMAHETLMVAYHPDRDAVVTWGQTKTQTAAFTDATTRQAFVFLDAQDLVRPNYAQLLGNIKSL